MSENTTGPRIDASTINSFLQLVAAANAGGDSSTTGTAILRGVLGQAGVSPDQTAILETVGAFGGMDDDPDDRDAEQRHIDRLLDFADGTAPHSDVQRGTGLSEFSDTDTDTQNAAFQDALVAELEDLREMNDTLASALGACPMCWGGADDCDVCNGAGMPGSQPPDRRLFKQLVSPAVRRMQQEGESVRRPRPRPSEESGQRKET